MKKYKQFLIAFILFGALFLFSIMMSAQDNYQIVAFSNNTMDNYIQSDGFVSFNGCSIVITDKNYNATIDVDYNNIEAYKKSKQIVIECSGIIYVKEKQTNVRICRINSMEHIELTILFNKDTWFSYYIKRNKVKTPIIW